MHVLRNVALQFHSARRLFLKSAKLVVVSFTSVGIAQDFVSGVECLRLRDGVARAVIHVGMKLLGKQAVRSADLCVGAMTV